jgi:membrane-associated phospholipid phosphatase
VGIRGRARAAALWALQMWAYQQAFELPYRKPWRHRRRLRIDYPIRLDSALAGGTPPSMRLQHALRRPPEITWLDRAVAGVYWLWEVEPHAVLLWILVRRNERFVRAAAQVGGVFWTTLIPHALVPTAPPWWASEVGGRMNGEVKRVMIEVARDLRHQSRLREEHSLGANPWASMPSNHTAAAAAVAMVLSEEGALPGALGWGYTAALGFSLVYLGEHYVVDLIAGLATAVLVRSVTSALLPERRRGWRALR